MKLLKELLVTSYKTQIKNTRVKYNYFVNGTFEAGIKLKGTEVKSLREGKCHISDAFVRIDSNNVPVLYSTYIYPYGGNNDIDPTRPRLLLLHSKEIRFIKQQIQAKGKVIIPIRLYFKISLAKIEIALCKPKKRFYKREALKKRVKLLETSRNILDNILL